MRSIGRIYSKEGEMRTKKEISKANIWMSESEKTIRRTLDFLFTNHYTHLSSSYSVHCPSQLHFLFCDTALPYTACLHPHGILPYDLATNLYRLPHLSFLRSPQNLLLYYYQSPTYIYSFTSVGLPPPHIE